jgi:signal transduction histidine kinase
MRELNLDRSQTWLALACAALLAALAAALVPGGPAAVVIALAVLGAAGVFMHMAPGTLALIRRRKSVILVGVLAALIIAWVVAGVLQARGGGWSQPILANGTSLPPFRYLDSYSFTGGASWPWRLGRLPLIPLLIMLLCAAGGFVLNADAVRVQLGYAQPRRSNWRLLTSAPTRGGRIAVRAVPGVALVAVAAFIGISLVSEYVLYHPTQAMLAIIVIAAITALLIAGPAAVGLTLRVDIDKEGRAREEERQRFAAHLHDSVLQTLALIQRQASDPEAVAKLARRQEHALRAWMAGETDLSSATVAGAVRDMVSDVEDEQGIKVELTAIGDAKLDGRSEEMIAAAREALRNSARHAPGATVNVFLDVNGHGIELFVRDSGPGFEFEAVPPERRGLRDAVIGRMSLTGGSATVESTPGEGTEIALKLPPSGRTR